MPRSQEALARLIESEVRDARVVQAFREVDRVHFVPAGSEVEAYDDRPVMLPERQTTSQPSLIARMIEAANVQPETSVLEVGTGYGFQTALLARLARRVVSIERFEVLADAARANLARIGCANAAVVVGDGWRGWPAAAPFDAIVVSAAAESLPAALGEQLAVGGRLVVPLQRAMSDDVVLFQRTADGLEQMRVVTPARFVPLVKGVPG